MERHDRIEMNMDVLCGKAVVKGSRLGVDFIVGLLAQGWSEVDVLDAYPGLTRDDILACLKYAAEAITHEQWLTVGS